MLLARLRGVESHRLGYLRPGQAGAAGGEQQPGFEALGLGACCGQQRKRVQEVFRREGCRAPQGELREVHRRRRHWRGSPGTSIKFFGPQAQQSIRGVLLTAGEGVIVVRGLGDVVLAWHATMVHNQQNVVNGSLKGVGMVVALHDAVAETCGAKAAALGELRRAGLPVPDGFVIGFDAYRAAFNGLDITSSNNGRNESGAAQLMIGTRALRPDLLEAVARGLDVLANPPVAVRSSAADEDAAGASAAGQHESILAAQGIDEVVDAVRICWASLHSARANDYRSGPGHHWSSGDSAMAVLIQRLVDADTSGVMFTAAGPEGGTEIEASWGLGLSVVGGTVTPDAYRVAADGAVACVIGEKRTRLDRHGRQVAISSVSGPVRTRPTLDDATVLRLARYGTEIADMLGGAQDIEWAIADGNIWILQARPVTAAPPSPPPSETSATPSAALTGTPGSHGSATGTARIVRGPDDFSRVHPGDILVCPSTDPSWTPLLRFAAGVVTETGGILSHAAIVAREYRIPAVLGTRNATSRIRDGTAIIVDGTTGTIKTTST